MKRRFLSILLVCAMIITMLPQGVSATGGTNSLTAGNTYYFDLSDEDIPGTINDDLPDTTLHYVPFTYAGTVDAYVLKPASSNYEYSSRDAADTTASDAEYGYTYAHRMFIADYNIKHTVSWDTLNGAGMIFGKTYTAYNADYTLRAPSAGHIYKDDKTEQKNYYSGGAPEANEWDILREKGYIKNVSSEISTWSQDIYSIGNNNKFYTVRGDGAQADHWDYIGSGGAGKRCGFRPVLEIKNTADDIKAVVLDLNGGSLSGSTNSINLAVKSGEVFTAPAAEGITAPETGYSLAGWSNGTNTYAPGEAVPAGVTSLTAVWQEKSGYTVKFNTAGGSAVDNKVNVKWTDKVLDSISAPVRNGYEFKGWKCGDTDVTADTTCGELAVNDTAMTVTLTAQWRDIEPPTGEIAIGEIKWLGFDNGMTLNSEYNKYFKGDQTVRIAASDNSGAPVISSYIVSSSLVEESVLDKAVWTPYDEAFELKDEGEHIIYAMLLDGRFNRSYVNTSKIIIDKTPPVISGIEDNGTYYGNVTVTIEEANLHGVLLNNEPVSPDENNRLILRPANGSQVIKAYDKAGNITEKTVTVRNYISIPSVDIKTTPDGTTSTIIKDTKTETVKNEQGEDISKITAKVSDKVADKLVDQAVSNKSDTVEITVKSDNGNKAGQIEIEIPKKAVESIAKDTEADLVIKTDIGQVTLDNKTLETMAAEAEGDTVRLVVNENTQLKEAQKSVLDIIGDRGHIFDLGAIISGKYIHDFRGGRAHVTLPVPEKLKGKDIVIIYINDKGICEILNHTVETVGAEEYIRFTTSHFSTFAVVEKTDADKIIDKQNAGKINTLIKEIKLKASTSKTSKKNIKVRAGNVKNLNSLIKEAETMGYTVKYKFYRSTEKASKYTAKITKKSSVYINTKGRKGTKYYYKAKVLVYDGKTLIAQTELKQCRYGVRGWSK